MNMYLGLLDPQKHYLFTTLIFDIYTKQVDCWIIQMKSGIIKCLY